MAGFNFAEAPEGMRKLIIDFSDSFHRGPNDVKGATLLAGDGRLRRAMTHGTYIFNLRHKPFGSKAWAAELKGLLDRMVATYDHQYDVFQKYKHRIGRDWTRNRGPFHFPQDDERLWRLLPSARTFAVVGPLVKGSRWFSWWDDFAHHEEDLYVLLLVVESAYGPQAVVAVAAAGRSAQDDMDALHKAKKEGNTKGIPFVLKLLTDALVQEMAIVYYISKPAWESHARRAKHVQNPGEVAEHTVQLSQGLWYCAEGPALIRTAFQSLETLRKVHVPLFDEAEACVCMRVCVGRLCPTLEASVAMAPCTFGARKEVSVGGCVRVLHGFRPTIAMISVLGCGLHVVAELFPQVVLSSTALEHKQDYF